MRDPPAWARGKWVALAGGEVVAAEESLAEVELELSSLELGKQPLHDLRHTAACYLAMSGATLAEIAEVLGHKTQAMVWRYAHLTEGHTRCAASWSG